jgi:bifunctional non-homologous end joining protein LigD
LALPLLALTLLGLKLMALKLLMRHRSAGRLALGSQSVARPSKTVTEIEGRQVTLSNLDKVLYPEIGFTKAAVVDYYARIAPAMLPHLRGRALTMVRWPDGVDGESFFEKRCPPHAPDWVRTATVDGVRACVADEVATLVWTANLAALELHTPQATVDDPEHPTSLVIDLDPGAPAGVVECCRVALRLREMLEQLGLVAVVKTSGGKGLHLAVPVRGATADATKAFARALGQLLAKEAPDRVTIVMARDVRKGRVFVDWSQNDRHKTTVCAYSLRARPWPSVSAPLSWDEVSNALDGGDGAALDLDAPAVLDRIARLGDLYAPNVQLEQELPTLGGG